MKGRLKKLKPIPKFHSTKEEREFWETHDATEYFDEQNLIELAPHVRDVKLIHVYVAPDGSRYITIPEEIKKTKAQIANSTSTHGSALMVGSLSNSGGKGTILF